MATIRNQNEPLRLFFRRLGTFALLAVVVVVAMGVWKVYGKERESHQLRREAELQRDSLAQQSARLDDETAKLKTDRGREELLREQYDVGKQGEGLIVIVEPVAPEPVATSTSLMQKLKKAFTWW
ncbi:hypothetical protein K8R03_02120 [Candidatus Kaiserbacteria bacterium]|nr:hypothetical protein [Candidatus Kaiserbacteria bacterium]